MYWSCHLRSKDVSCKSVDISQLNISISQDLNDSPPKPQISNCISSSNHFPPISARLFSRFKLSPNPPVLTGLEKALSRSGGRFTIVPASSYVLYDPPALGTCSIIDSRVVENPKSPMRSRGKLFRLCRRTFSSLKSDVSLVLGVWSEGREMEDRPIGE
jgi:hypothetical protein